MIGNTCNPLLNNVNDPIDHTRWTSSNELFICPLPVTSTTWPVHFWTSQSSDSSESCLASVRSSTVTTAVIISTSTVTSTSSWKRQERKLRGMKSKICRLLYSRICQAPTNWSSFILGWKGWLKMRKIIKRVSKEVVVHQEVEKMFLISRRGCQKVKIVLFNGNNLEENMFQDLQNPMKLSDLTHALQILTTEWNHSNSLTMFAFDAYHLIMFDICV